MYHSTSQPLVLRDSPEHIDFHIKTGDYFSFLATMMGFMEEALSRCESELVSEQERSLARELRHDLRYIQANYEISPRPLAEIQMIRGKGNLIAQD